MGGPGLMRVSAPVVLEDESDGGEDHEKHANQEKPPSDRRADGGHRASQPGEQRPPAVRAEEAEFPGALTDLALWVVLGPQGQPAPGEQDVEAGEERQSHGQRERGGPGGVLREMPVHDVGAGEERGTADEQVPFDLHLTPPLPARPPGRAGTMARRFTVTARWTHAWAGPT